MNTFINQLNDEENQNIHQINSKNCKEYALDLSIDESDRLKALETYYEFHDMEVMEIINKLGGMYVFSGTKILENYLVMIAIKSNLPIFYRYQAVDPLLSFEEIDEVIHEKKDSKMIKEIKQENNKKIIARNLIRKTLAYNTLQIVLDILIYDEQIATPLKMQCLFQFMNSSNEIHQDYCKTYLIYLINDLSVDCDYRYKCILSLEKNKVNRYEYFIQEACLSFIENEQNVVNYRILACQFVLFHDFFHEKSFIENVLVSIAKDKNIEYNLRADAADILLNKGTNEMKLLGHEIINELSFDNMKKTTIFDNKQNVHVKEIETSVMEILDILSTHPIQKKNANDEIDFEDIQNKIMRILETEYENIQKIEKITLSLNRICIDRSIYKNYSLTNIFVKLWSYIQTRENIDERDELTKRLLEELVDMSGTCSSGFLSRLVNTLSGFDGLSIRISWDDQIVSSFVGRLNAYASRITDENSLFYQNHDILYNVVEIIMKSDPKKYGHIFETMGSRKINDEKIHYSKTSIKEIIDNYLSQERETKIKDCIELFSENVINEMTIISSAHKERRHFLLFFKIYMQIIYKDMLEEYREYITESEFDLAFRKAIYVYEGEK